MAGIVLHLQEGKDLEHSFVAVRNFLGHDLVQHGHRDAQQRQRLPLRQPIRVEVLVQRGRIPALSQQRSKLCYDGRPI